MSLPSYFITCYLDTALKSIFILNLFSFPYFKLNHFKYRWEIIEEN